MRNREWCRLRYERGWVYDFRDITLPWYHLESLNLRELRALWEDVFLYAYTPRPGDVVVDVGAGVGEDTIWFSRAVGSGGRVVAIEAHPWTYERLQQAIRLNALDNTTGVHVAVTDHEGKARISEEEGARGSSIVGGNGIHEVPVTTLDRIAQSLQINEVALVKMNIEGAERLAVRGMRDLLTRTRNVCICCHDFLVSGEDDRVMQTRAAVQAFLSEHGMDVSTREDDPRPQVRNVVYGKNRELV